MEKGDSGGYGGDGSDRWWFSGSHVSVFLLYTYIYICSAKIFYDTMKYNKMNDGIFKFLCLHGKYFIRIFTP